MLTKSITKLLFQSTSPVRGTTSNCSLFTNRTVISIHVPREGDDKMMPNSWNGSSDFNPRPP